MVPVILDQHPIETRLSLGGGAVDSVAFRARLEAASGSGGDVILHLPLFAAAAAFYDSAAPGSPRLIALDEAFAGIDAPTRGELLGLLCDFDLDVFMTSFEEWGFYPQLDGLSTYHLAREKGMPGVYSDWFVWNGREPVQMQT